MKLSLVDKYKKLTIVAVITTDLIKICKLVSVD